MPRKDDFGYVWMTVPKNYRYAIRYGALVFYVLILLSIGIARMMVFLQPF